MKKTIGLLAHVDAGKTTFAEQLLYFTKSIRQKGRVDHKDSFLDSHEIERQRGITVFADQATMSYKNSEYYLIDTPGHVDFSPEMERAIKIMDAAVLIISAVEGIQGHTETVWQLLRKHNIPTFFFINKVDRTGADPTRVLHEIRENFTGDVCDIVNGFKKGEMNPELIEFVAERDEELLETYMGDGYEPGLWLARFQEMIMTGTVFPFAYGSALQDIGITEFLEKLDQLTITNNDETLPFTGRVYKIRYDENGNRITFVKALSGTLNVRETVGYQDGEELRSEKVTGLRIYNGNKSISADTVRAGDLFGIVGLTKTAAGDFVDTGEGSFLDKSSYELIPALKSKVIFPAPAFKETLKSFMILSEEDPSLHAVWDESLQELHIHVMGTIQLEVLEHVAKERFGLNVGFGTPEILYKETIETETVGYGHFEPLGHYAEVHLKLEPAPPNSGLSFENLCHSDDLPTGYQNLVRQHLFERDHRGLLTGSPVTDINVTLLTGRSHNKHTSGGDFREATYRALRQGLEKTRSILLEPYYEFKIKVEYDLIGRVLTDVQAAHGSFEAPVTEGNKAIVTGLVPVATFMNYSTVLASFTHGKGSLSLKFGGYGRCHNEQEIIEKIGYNKNADPEYTSSSIFCAKGSGYTVPWDEAEAKMHALGK